FSVDDADVAGAQCASAVALLELRRSRDLKADEIAGVHVARQMPTTTQDAMRRRREQREARVIVRSGRDPAAELPALLGLDVDIDDRPADGIMPEAKAVGCFHRLC